MNITISEKEVEELVLGSPFAARMQYLSENQQLGRNQLHEGFTPNCSGTVLFVINAEDLVWGRTGKPRRGVPCSDGYGDETLLPLSYRPGYVSMQHMMELLFEDDKVIETCKDDAINGIVVFSSYQKQKHRAYVIHCGVYLGQAAGRDVMFHQYNKGGRFETMFVEDYLQRPVSKEHRDLGNGFLCVSFHRIK